MGSKIKILTIVGARPQIIKSSAISRAIRNHFSDKIDEVIVHTGQHYDANMSEVFFQEMEIPKPGYNLGVGSGTHGKQTAKMLEGIEDLLLKENPTCIVLYGDTNSTLAGAIAAVKIHCPVVHIEAGLRSYNKKMPEEINRIMCDHVSTLLFSPTESGYNNLIKEGFSEANKMPFHADKPGIFHCGDVMYDNSLYFAQRAEEIESVGGVDLQNPFILATIHRDHNTDYPEKLQSIFRALLKITKVSGKNIILPLHPRTSKMLEITLGEDLYSKVLSESKIQLIAPVSFIDMIALESKSDLIVTDSGGVQKESYFFKKPCIVLRPETEWKELIEIGTAKLADADEQRIMDSYSELSGKKKMAFPPVYGDGKAAEFICQKILDNFSK